MASRTQFEIHHHQSFLLFLLTLRQRLPYVHGFCAVQRVGQKDRTSQSVVERGACARDAVGFTGHDFVCDFQLGSALSE